MDQYKVIVKETYLILMAFLNFLFMVSLVHEMNTSKIWNYETMNPPTFVVILYV